MLMRITTCLNVTALLRAVSLCLMLFFSSPLAAAADRAAGDEFLTGYVASILERELHWERDSYMLKIVNGVATITLFKDDPMRQEAADKELRTIDGLQGVAVVVKPADVAKPGALSRFMGITGEAEAFPTGDLFRPLIADPKQQQFFVSVKAGLEFGHPNPGQRRLRLMAEWYKGFGPHGQFYNNKVEYYGMEVSLGF